MTLPPDVLTDLVILYHAGEASQATRALLEEEASQNPQLRAALEAPPRNPPPLAAVPPDDGLRVVRDIRILFRRRLIFFSTATALLVLALTAPALQKNYPWFPFAVLLASWIVALFTLRAHRRAKHRL